MHTDLDNEIDGLKALVKLYKRVFWVIVAVAVVVIAGVIILNHTQQIK